MPLGRNFTLLFAGRATSYVGTYLAPIAVAFAVLDLGGGATAVGLSFAAWTLAQVALLAFGGTIGDRLPRRSVMIASDLSSTAVRTVMGMLLVTGHARVWELIALQALGGASVAFYNPTFYGLVREIVPPERMQRANGLLSIARNAAFPVGAAVGGTIVAAIGTGEALLVDAATYAASAALLSRVRVQSLARAGSSLLHDLRAGWQAFTETTWVWVAALHVALYFLLTYAPFFVLGPTIAQDLMHGPRSWAVVVTGEGIGALLGGIAGLRFDPRRPLAAVMPLFFLTAVQNVVLALHPSTWLLAPSALLSGFAFSLGGVTWDTTMQRTVPPEKLARVAAYAWMGAMVFLPAGYALAGPISMLIGRRADLLLAACWITAATAVVVRLRAVRDLAYEPAPEQAPVVA